MRRDQSVQQKYRYLIGKRIDVAISGGIAAIEMVKVIRELRRWGAEIRVFMSNSSLKFVTPLSIEWAAGSKPISSLSGGAEQISDADLLLIAPATLNTIQKGVNGIADSPLLTNFQSAWGRGIPVVIAPSMHIDLWNNPIFKETLKKLKENKQFKIVEPVFEEDKAKLASSLTIALSVSFMLNNKLNGKRVLLTGGPTEEEIDGVRVLRNKSSGRLSCLIAQELIANGAEVEFIYGPGTKAPPPLVNLHRVNTVSEMRFAIKKVLESRKIEIGIFCAAVLDFSPERFNYKLDSNKPVAISLTPGPKLIDEISGIPKIGFKLESALTFSDLVTLGNELLISRAWEAVVVNSNNAINADKHQAVFISKGRDPISCNTKEEIASVISQFLLLQNLGYQPK